MLGLLRKIFGGKDQAPKTEEVKAEAPYKVEIPAPAAEPVAPITEAKAAWPFPVPEVEEKPKKKAPAKKKAAPKKEAAPAEKKTPAPKKPRAPKKSQA